MHGFCDASENAYGGVIYFRMVDSFNKVHDVTLVISKTKVAPIKKLTVNHLELCGTHLLSQLICHTKEVYQFPFQDVYALTDSTIVLKLACWYSETI
jgi:hypothetical protein